MICIKRVCGARELRMRSRLSSGWPGRRAASTSVGAAAGRVPGPDNAVIHRIQAAGLAAVALAHVEGTAVRIFALFGPAPGAAGRNGEGARRASLQEVAVGGAAVVAQIR